MFGPASTPVQTLPVADPRDARIAELERIAYIGEHHHADLTWKARCEETQRQLDEARALVEAATCFAFGGTSRPAFAYRTQFGHVDNDVTWCAGVPEGDDVECESRDSAIAKARALAKEDGK